MNSGNKRLGWLAMLALNPVVGWGQQIIQDPQNATVCLGEEAVFTAVVRAGSSGWYLK